jgi:NDP-sugar pyrophosphorylase family protein
MRENGAPGGQFVRFAIIGAGEGSRLKSEGFSAPKPLIRIGGVPMIERIIRSASANGFDSVHLIMNPAFGEVCEYIGSLDFGIPVTCRLLSTPSSMHTLFALEPALRDGPFCMTTVDTVFREAEFREFVSFATGNRNVDGVLAVTDYIDDERPLCVTIDGSDVITGFFDSKDDRHWATGGIYYFSPAIFRERQAALESGITRLRNFLRLLVERGYMLKAFRFSKIIDVDHASDVTAAERFLSQEE